MSTKPLKVVHVIHQLSTGGLENGLVNLINGIDPAVIQHSVFCMTNSTAFRERITQPNVGIYEFNKNPYGRDFAAQRRVFDALKKIKPDIVHSRNLTGLDAVLPAFLARVPVRIHGEHGRDMTDPDGTNKKFILLKKLHRPFIHRWSSVSRDLADALIERVGIPAAQISQIYNGVNLSRFERALPRRNIEGYWSAEHVVFGTVGRLQDVKEQWLLIEALALLKKSHPRAANIRMVIVGDGPMRERLENAITAHQVAPQVLLAGNQSDVPRWMQSMDGFCLPSRAEGISNTVLEAMGCGLPVIATRVGGNPELVVDGETGALINHSDAQALADAIARYLDAPMRIRIHGDAGYARAHANFSLQAMISAYTRLYMEMAGR